MQTWNRRTRIVSFLLLLGLTGLVGAAQRRTADVVPTPVQAPAIDAVFVLDTTGSMSGLIEGAKRKIWSIANQMAEGQPSPVIRMGLVAYRDRGDAYVTRRFDLTDDLDAVYGELMQLHAGGGGDAPESVNQALHEAVEQMSWSQGSGVYRAIFLVGDAPPHMDYRGDVPWNETVAMARQRGIVVNTVQCGAMAETRPVWEQIASLGSGRYAAVAQDGGMVALATPMDEKLGRLNAALADTALAWGTKAHKDELEGKLALARRAPASVASSRLAYMAKASEPALNSGRLDLVGALDAGEVELENVPAEELPAVLRKLPREKQQALVDEKRTERTRLQQEVDELVAKRDVWLEAERKRRGEDDGFDRQVLEMLAEQTERLGLRYGAEKR
jgi:Mg-chelatase subunit ChlD